MSTPPGNYDNLDALTAAPPDAAPAATSDGLQPAPAQPATDFTFVAEGRPGVSMPGFLITLDDTIQLTVWNSNTFLTSVTLQLRVLKPDGALVMEAYSLQNLTADRTPNVLTTNQLSGYIVGAVIGPPGATVARGTTFVTLAVVRGTVTNPLMTEVLLADYVSTGFQPGWPYGRVVSAVEGPGVFYGVSGANPLAGFEATLFQPATARWQVQTVEFSLTTSASSGPRQTYLYMANGGTLIWIAAAAAPQGPGTTVKYTWAIGQVRDASVPANLLGPCPQSVVLANGSHVQTVTTSLDAGDQYTPLMANVQEWIDV